MREYITFVLAITFVFSMFPPSVGMAVGGNAASFKVFPGLSESSILDGIVYCQYGDSITDDDSPSGNQTSGSESKGVCDFCDPLVDAGVEVVSMGWNGAETEDDSEPATVDSCSPNYDSCANSGEQAALECDSSCPGGGLTTSCRDVRGDTTLDSTCIEDIAQYCDVFGFMLGTNDDSESVPNSTVEGVITDVADEAIDEGKPIIFWHPPPSYIERSRYARQDDYRQHVLNGISAASDSTYVHLLDMNSAFTDIKNRLGAASERSLFDDCGPSFWQQDLWDAGGCNMNVPGCGGIENTDCIHPERFVGSDAIDGRIPANWMGEIMKKKLLEVYKEHYLFNQ